MFSSRGLCQVRRTGVFEDVLQVKGSIEVNCIEPLKGNDSVKVEGYTAVDDLVSVSINLSEAVLVSSFTSFAYVADRPVEVLAIREIHRIASVANGEVSALKRLASGAADQALALNIPVDGADDTTAVVGGLVNPVLAKGDAIFVNPTGVITNLSGGVLTFILKQL